MILHRPLALVLCLLSLGGVDLGHPAEVGAQTPDTVADTLDQGPHGTARGEWNDARVRDLMTRAHAVRRGIIDDGELESYRAVTQGHIYFFVDPDEGERSLIRVDQVAVELLWQAPDVVRQQVIGERSEVRLPVRNFDYYLDRLTLVQYGFSDEIQVGAGMDVAGVPNPLAVALLDGEDRVYDYRMVDTVTLTLVGRSDPIRLVEVEVRPVDPRRPGAMGTVLLDEKDGSLVRMHLGFTPASYVDRRTDRIEVEVDYGLWEGRYWLPNRQVVQVRREVPDLDLGVGTVIRAVLRVGEYELNVELPPEFEFRPPVSRRPEFALRSYVFDEPLLAGLERDGVEGLEARPDPRRLRSDALRRLAGESASGLAPLRLHLPRASSLVRYNRAEGLYLGLGTTLAPSPALRLRSSGGFALGAGRPVLGVEADGIWGDARGWTVEAAWNDRPDLGLAPAAAPLLGSLGATFRGEDYLDPVRRSRFGGTLVLGGRSEASELRLHAGVRRDRDWSDGADRAPLDRGSAFRPLRPIEEGTFAEMGAGVSGSLRTPGGGVGGGELSLRTAWGLDGEGQGVAGAGRFRSTWHSTARDRDLSLGLLGWAWMGDPLPQEHRLLGGRGTVPGYPFREWAGRRAGLISLEAATDAGTPFFRVRAGLHAAASGGLDEQVAEVWGVTGTGGVRPAATLGLGVGWDLLRIDGARGLRGGEWQLLFSVDPRWWDRL
ncbi:MAG: hypothetical protein EA422_10955 [Gemmatimonadales bacterium]|nr:MAG: hypothetical protein EA422_10955 [Gemmatimonadales bacterium]